MYLKCIVYFPFQHISNRISTVAACNRGIFNSPNNGVIWKPRSNYFTPGPAKIKFDYAQLPNFIFNYANLNKYNKFLKWYFYREQFPSFTWTIRNCFNTHIGRRHRCIINITMTFGLLIISIKLIARCLGTVRAGGGGGFSLGLSIKLSTNVSQRQKTFFHQIYWQNTSYRPWFNTRAKKAPEI